MKKLYVYVLISSMLLASVAVTFVGFSAAQDAPFVVGTATNPPKIDPQNQYDSESAELIGQVCEGLLRYNYTSPEMEGIPQLATAVGTLVGNEATGYNYTMTLRDDVTFHNGDKFNASAVKWTFDRIQYFSYGLWIGGEVYRALELMESYTIFAVSGVPILNDTIIESEYVVRFVLNTAPGFFEKLLAFMATQIMLPDDDYAQGDKFQNFLSLNDELIGTGPFKLVEYEFDTQVVFAYYEDYYLDRPANFIKNMIYLIVPDAVTRSLAILNYEIHWGGVIADYQDEFDLDPNLVQVDVNTLVVFYIQMNMVTMPDDVRKASLYAYNYTYTLVDRLQETQLELHTPVPNGMLYHYEGFDGEPYTNLTLARDFMLNCPELAVNVTAANLDDTNVTADWNAVADSNNPLAWYNFTGYTGLDNYYIQLSQDMRDIGIRIDLVPLMPWGTYLEEYLHDEEGNAKLTYSFGGWGPDYNDPINMIEPLYGRNSEGGPASANCFLLNDPGLNDLLNESYFATGSTDPTREKVFQDIQELIVVDLAPSFYIYQRAGSLAFNKLLVEETSITDMMNSFSDYYWFNVQFYPPIPKIPGFEIFTLLAVGLGVTVFLVFYLRKRN